MCIFLLKGATLVINETDIDCYNVWSVKRSYDELYFSVFGCLYSRHVYPLSSKLPGTYSVSVMRRVYY